MAENTSSPSIFADAPAQAHPLMQRLVREHGAHWVDQATLPAWLTAAAGDAVILIAGDAVRFPEGLDVAVVLPELRTESCRPFRIGIATPGDEDAIGQRYGAQRRPSLVFVRDGRYVTTVSGMHDWTDFMALVVNALASPTTHAPIAIQAAGAPASSCH
jgi:hydrogenase-1 operon protein HyaE